MHKKPNTHRKDLMKMAKQDAQEAKRKEARSAYYKEWRKKNPDKVKAIQDRFFDKLAARMENDSAARR